MEAVIISRRKKVINYGEDLKPIYIDAMEANQFYMNDYVNETGKQIQFKLGKDKYVDFEKISTRKAVLNDSLFLRFMESSITRNVGDICNDFVVLKFNYDVNFKTNEEEIKIDVHELRKANNNTALKFIEKSKKALKENGIRPNGKYPYVTNTEIKMRKQCKVDMVSDAKIKSVLWDGMGLIDESIFPANMDGFIYCRSHFFKSCLFRGNIQEFFKDYCKENNIDYESHTVEDVDMFGRKLRLPDIKVIITDKSIKWIGKFVDMMGGTDEMAYEYYRKYMKSHGDYFSIVKTAHPSKWDDLQLSTYQMNNSLPTTNRKVLGGVGKEGIDFLNCLKESDEEYLKYLDKTKDDMNINELIIELVNWNPDFVKTEFFRTKKSKDISKLKDEFEKGRLPQSGDNLTIMDNPIALLLKAVGNKDFLNEGCFELVNDGVQCYAPRFNDGDRLAAFRSPHNSPNNILHFYNVYPEKLIRYFPNIGQNVIVFNAIKTDTQARASGHDCDSDFVYVTNQKDLADLARKAYYIFV